ncbi:MAG: DUF4351 domain-containing protein [Acidobacteria bacterium]|nr:DUF4351 domain-containing protein [Acidobacteriota bacterium]
MLLIMLEEQVGKLNQRTLISLQRLAAEKLENLAKALLKFTSVRDLSQWLSENGVNDKPAMKTASPRKTNGRRA